MLLRLVQRLYEEVGVAGTAGETGLNFKWRCRDGDNRCRCNADHRWPIASIAVSWRGCFPRHSVPQDCPLLHTINGMSPVRAANIDELRRSRSSQPGRAADSRRSAAAMPQARAPVAQEPRAPASTCCSCS